MSVGAVATLVLLLAFLSGSLGCQDDAGHDYCQYVLLRVGNKCDNLKASDLGQCLKTCKVCQTPTASSRPPPWAIARPTVRRPMGTRLPPSSSDESETFALPLYAVILIIVALLAIFIAITVCILKLKKKWKNRKLRKMSRNRELLKGSAPQANTIPPNYLWTTGSVNDAYYTTGIDPWATTNGVVMNNNGRINTMGPLNNEGLRDHGAEKNNINVLQNQTNRRSAPKAAEGTNGQNLSNNVSKERLLSRGKAPAPQPPTVEPVIEPPLKKVENSQSLHQEPQNIVSIPIQRSASPFSDIQTKENQPTPTPDSKTLPTSLRERNGITEELLSNRRNIHDAKRRSDKGYDSDETMTTHTVGSMSVATEDTISAPALVNILGEWKGHLEKQKKELEVYYKDLHSYINYAGLKPIGEEERDIGRSTEAEVDPKPDHDESNLQEAIYDLKNKLSSLQNLLEKPKESDFKHGYDINSPIEDAMLPRSFNGMEVANSPFTIKTLLKRLGQSDRLKLQVRIAEALETSRRRGKMTVGSRDGPITCLSKQIHNIMSDLLDPRTSTKIELGANAALTLTNKLLTNVQCNLLPVLHNESAKHSVSKTADRIYVLAKQLPDMTKQLTNKHGSFQEKDFAIFVGAFVDNCEKIMNTTFHLVCVIVDLQSEERRMLVRNPAQSLPSQTKSDFRKLPPSRQLTLDYRPANDIPPRQVSGSNCTSLSTFDVRRLNDDIARLRQLLDTDGKFPSLSDVTSMREPKPDHVMYPHVIDPVYTEIEESECDCQTTVSCSTCMPRPDELDYSNENGPVDARYEEERVPAMFPVNDDPILVQNIPDIEAAMSEMFRPATRPRHNPNCFANVTTTIEQDLDLPAIDRENQIESSKQSGSKPSGVVPSSFASFRSENLLRNDKNEGQPRHQMMLGRYFGGEVIQPTHDHQTRTEKILEEPPIREVPVVLNGSGMSPMRDDKTESPMPKMLPCGIIAMDTPPLDNPPKKKIVPNLLDIPEITVYRNGTKEQNEQHEDGSANLSQPSSSLEANHDESNDIKPPANLNLQENPKGDRNSSDVKSSISQPTVQGMPVPNERDKTDSVSLKSVENILSDYPDDEPDDEISPSPQVDSIKSLNHEEEPKLPGENGVQSNDDDDSNSQDDGEMLVPEFEFPRVESSLENSLNGGEEANSNDENDNSLK